MGHFIIVGCGDGEWVEGGVDRLYGGGEVGIAKIIERSAFFCCSVDAEPAVIKLWEGSNGPLWSSFEPKVVDLFVEGRVEELFVQAEYHFLDDRIVRRLRERAVDKTRVFQFQPLVELGSEGSVQLDKQKDGLV